MSQYLGDFKASATVYFTWNTNDGNGGSVNPTVAGTISVYKDDSIVQTVIGVTDVRAFDGLVGVHLVTIVTTNAFYALGHDYHVVLSASTIDGQIVNATLASFSIENRFNDIDADLSLHLGAGIGGRNIGNILPQLAQSEFEQRTNIFATVAVVAQGIDDIMVARGCIQYQQVDMSLTRNFVAPDKTYYLLYHYDAQRMNDIVKPSLVIVW